MAGSGGYGPSTPKRRRRGAGGRRAPQGPDMVDRGRELGPRRQRGPDKPKRAKFRPPEYGPKQNVKGGVKKRAQRRIKALGGVPGVNAKDGITGREARKVKRSWLREGRPSPGGGSPGRGNAPRRPPVDPFRQEVNALTRLQFGGQQQELDYERRLSEQHGANLGGWYQNYLNTVQQAAQQQQAFTQGLQAAQFQQANQAAGTDQAQNQQLLAQQQQQAAQRGMTVDPSVAQNMQQGVAARQAQGTAFGGLIGAQGQAQAGYLQNRVGIAAGEGVQAQQDEMRKRQQVEKLAMDLKKDIGAFKVKTRADIQGREHTQELENRAFGLDVVKEQADQAEARRDDRRLSKAERRQQREARSRMRDRKLDNRRDRAKLRLDKDKYRLDVRKEERMRDQDLADDGRLNNSSGGSKGKSNFTPTQRRNNRASLRNLVHRVDNNIDPPDSVDPLLARAAVQIAEKGGVTPELARKIRRQFGFTPKIKRPGPHELGAKPSPLGPK